jgi:hypothetical protein
MDYLSPDGFEGEGSANRDNEFNPYTCSLYHSKQDIIPEFQPFLALLIFMLATLLIFKSSNKMRITMSSSTVSFMETQVD